MSDQIFNVPSDVSIIGIHYRYDNQKPATENVHGALIDKVDGRKLQGVILLARYMHHKESMWYALCCGQRLHGFIHFKPGKDKDNMTQSKMKRKWFNNDGGRWYYKRLDYYKFENLSHCSHALEISVHGPIPQPDEFKAKIAEELIKFKLLFERRSPPPKDVQLLLKDKDAEISI